MKMNRSRKPGHEIAVSSTRSIIREILAPTDFSAESQAGVRHAFALGDKLGAAVALFHVVEPPSRMVGMEDVVLVREDSEATALARNQLTKLSQRKSKGNVAVTSSVRTGNTFHEITTTARERGVDLIVIATHGYTGAKRVLLGSTAERVVRHAPCPVLTVPARTIPKRIGKAPPFKIEKILVPIDFSNIAKDALPWAASFAAHFGAELVLLHVVQKFPIDYLLGRELMDQTLTPLMKQAEADLERMAADLSKSMRVKASAVVRDGTPYEAICQTAKSLGADLVVLTTHGHTGLKHVWLGSTAERVVRHAHCPVLAVRELNRKAL